MFPPINRVYIILWHRFFSILQHFIYLEDIGIYKKYWNSIENILQKETFWGQEVENNTKIE